MFEMANKFKSMKEEGEANDALNKKKSKKMLGPGYYFGEVSLIFGCKRSATVKAKQYSQCSMITQKEFQHLVSNHTFFRRFLVGNILKQYDDELKLFLVSCLREIDYLSSISDETLTHLSLHMIAMQEDKGSLLYDANDNSQRDKNECLIVIYGGTLAITTKIDSGEEVVIEYAKKGTILNAHNCLTGRPSLTSVKCLTSVTYYFLPVYKIIAISEAYPELRQVFDNAQHKSKFDKMNNLNPLDYKEIHFKFEEKYRFNYGV